jgi:hypothetical protein
MSSRDSPIPAPGPYAARPARPIIVYMTPPATATAPARRLVLVPAEPRTGRSDGAVRRYRLARLRLEGREVPPAERFAHCRRGYD